VPHQLELGLALDAVERFDDRVGGLERERRAEMCLDVPAIALEHRALAGDPDRLADEARLAHRLGDALRDDLVRARVLDRHVAGADALVGRQALVIEEISSQGGQIKVGGEVWTARPYDEDQVIPVGARVDVFQIKGATALVHPVPELG